MVRKFGPGGTVQFFQRVQACKTHCDFFEVMVYRLGGPAQVVRVGRVVQGGNNAFSAHACVKLHAMFEVRLDRLGGPAVVGWGDLVRPVHFSVLARCNAPFDE